MSKSQQNRDARKKVLQVMGLRLRRSRVENDYGSFYKVFSTT